MILSVFRNFRLVRGMRMLFFAAERCGEAGAGCGVEVGSRGGWGD